MKEEGYYSRFLEKRTQRSSVEDSTVSEALEESTEGKKNKKRKREIEERRELQHQGSNLPLTPNSEKQVKKKQKEFLVKKKKKPRTSQNLEYETLDLGIVPPAVSLVEDKESDQEETEEDSRDDAASEEGKDANPVDPPNAQTLVDSKGTISESTKVSEKLILSMSLRTQFNFIYNS
jgi:hypothetical protein